MRRPPSLAHHLGRFGAWLELENWSNLQCDTSLTPDNQVGKVQDLLNENLNQYLPLKTGRFTSNDKPYITCELKKLDRKKKKEYTKHGCSEKFKTLREEFDNKLVKAAQSHLQKNVTMLMEAEPGKAYSTLKKMGARPGDNLDDETFSLVEHLDANLTSKESVEKIASHFASVSQEYPALDISKLPQSVQSKLSSPDTTPQLSESDVLRLILKAKKPKAGVPGDLPRRLVRRFAAQLARPYTVIYNNIIQTGIWPAVWKVERGLPLKKCSNPINEDDIRVISLTAFYSKVFEKFVMEWLLFFIGDKIDPCQYGGEKGSGVAHYLIDFINFVQYNQDLKNIHAILAVAVDFKKAFNRQNHHILITLLSDMGVPGWLLSIVIGFLTNRELLVHFKGETSEKQDMPGGGPQGTLLGLFLFLILINAAGFKNLKKNTGVLITKPFNRRPSIENIHMKYIDDLMAATSLDLKENLVKIANPIRPLNYHERTSHVLPPSKCKMQVMMNELVDYANQHEMKINQHKTKAILFNQARNYDFQPNIVVNGVQLDVVPKVHVLGVTLRSDLSWVDNTENMCKKAFSRLWMLRRLKKLGASEQILVDIYQKQIRCVAEFAVAAWASSITKNEAQQIERIQKAALAIIYGQNYRNYQNALVLSGLVSLAERREDICLNFAKKASKNPKYQHWFVTEENSVNTRRKKPYLKPVSARTSRFAKSPIAYLTHLLNNDKKQA